MRQQNVSRIWWIRGTAEYQTGHGITENRIQKSKFLFNTDCSNISDDSLNVNRLQKFNVKQLYLIHDF